MTKSNEASEVSYSICFFVFSGLSCSFRMFSPFRKPCSVYDDHRILFESKCHNYATHMPMKKKMVYPPKDSPRKGNSSFSVMCRITDNPSTSFHARSTKTNRYPFSPSNPREMSPSPASRVPLTETWSKGPDDNWSVRWTHHNHINSRQDSPKLASHCRSARPTSAHCHLQEPPPAQTRYRTYCE